MKRVVFLMAMAFFVSLAVSVVPVASINAQVAQVVELEEANHTGILIKENNEYRLKLIKPIYFDKGSRSERIVKSIKLSVLASLKEKAESLVNGYVAVAGTRVCEKLYSPWTAKCEMTVKTIKGIK